MSPQKETPAQTIARLERELKDEKLRTLILNEMIDVIDEQTGAGLRKKLLAKELGDFKSKDK